MPYNFPNNIIIIIIIIIIIERFIDSENDVRQVEIIKQINSYTNNNKFKKKTL